MALIPLMTIVYDDQTREYMFRCPDFDSTKEHYRTRYGAIGQQLSELAGLICRRRYPHFMVEDPWIHVVPADDIIPHEHGPHVFECPCSPRVDCKHRIVKHTAMDGRPDYVRPKQEGWQELYADA